MCKNTVSFILRETTVNSGTLGEVDAAATCPREHNIRGISTSASFLRHWSVYKVLEAATWRLNSRCSCLYFNNIYYVFDNCCSLGLFVATWVVLV